MKSGKVMIAGYKCQRCGHVTRTRDGKPPVCCGKCKNPRWRESK